jgi:hypothetical protein
MVSNESGGGKIPGFNGGDRGCHERVNFPPALQQISLKIESQFLLLSINYDQFMIRYL